MKYYIKMIRRMPNLDNVYKNMYDVIKKSKGKLFEYDVKDIQEVTGYNEQQVKTLMRTLVDKKAIELMNEEEYNQYLEEQKPKLKKLNGKPIKDKVTEMIYLYSDCYELRNVLFTFVDMRKHHRRPVTETALKLIFKKLDAYCITDIQKKNLILKSIEHGWLTVYPDKKETPKEEKPNVKSDLLDYEYYQGVILVEEDRKRGIKYAVDMAKDPTYEEKLKIAKAIVLGE